MVTRHGLLGVLSVLGVAPACESDPCVGDFDPPPLPEADSSVPVVLDGEWIGAGILELRFSSSLRSVGDPDPARFSILGWNARFSEYGECGPQTAYRVLTAGYYQASVAEVWIAPEDDAILRARLSSPAAGCSIPGAAVGTGVMLVYTDRADAGPMLLDDSGDPIPAIGPSWALDRFESCTSGYGYGYCGLSRNYVDGHLPAVESLAPIPCP